MLWFACCLVGRPPERHVRRVWHPDQIAAEADAVSGSSMENDAFKATEQDISIIYFQVYLPSFMFVVTSWVSFLIKPEVVPGRMALLVTLFLVLINIFNSVRLDEDSRQIIITYHIIRHLSTGSRLQYPRD